MKGDSGGRTGVAGAISFQAEIEAIVEEFKREIGWEGNLSEAATGCLMASLLEGEVKEESME